MAAKSVEEILTRAISDRTFADLLFSDPDRAMAGYDLTDEEIEGLKAIFHGGFDQWLVAMREMDTRHHDGYDPF